MTRFKETGTLRNWKDEIQKLIRAIKLSIKLTVEIADDEWFADIDSILDGGKLINDSKTVTELFAHLAATLTHLSFCK